VGGLHPHGNTSKVKGEHRLIEERTSLFWEKLTRVPGENRQSTRFSSERVTVPEFCTSESATGGWRIKQDFKKEVFHGAKTPRPPPKETGLSDHMSTSVQGGGQQKVLKRGTRKYVNLQLQLMEGPTMESVTWGDGAGMPQITIHGTRVVLRFSKNSFRKNLAPLWEGRHFHFQRGHSPPPGGGGNISV